MLDQELLTQLKHHFSSLKKSVTLRMLQGDSADQSWLNLHEMLTQVAATSELVTLNLVPNQEDSLVGNTAKLNFELWVDDRFTGIRFRGNPGGHEFTSLVVAILNAGGLGKMPDADLQKMIGSIKGPIRLSTYISLSCENCPDIVQALNQMALIHDDFVHEMVDGAAYPEEAAALGLQGVPAVMHEGKQLHAGRGSLGDLLEKLAKHFGVRSTADDAATSSANAMEPLQMAVIGAGPAGVAAAIYSARKGLSTAIIADKLGGQVAETKGIENLISLDYIEGRELSADLGARLAKNEIQLLEHRRVDQVSVAEAMAEDSTAKSALFDLHLSGGQTIQSEQVIIATGAQWRQLNVPGEHDYLGRGVAYCPHCDGPYYKGKKVAVVGGGNSGVEAAIDLAAITAEVTLFEYADALNADQVLINKLNTLPNVKVHTSAAVKAIEGDGSKVTSIQWEDRKQGHLQQLELHGVFVQIGLSPNSKSFSSLVETNSMGEITVDDKNRTSIQGIYSAGDVTTTPYKQIIISMGEGAKAALSAFEDRLKGY